ncbi:MerR family transcriptional regulator [Aureimonas fodinaquatilis]|uniref:MerR family transcriptional regulator n=1 Tax=Aureimonas fodinaquatilis TaxID=2565783 RepID=A0A5B0DZT6_9HYPH|nr:MerR family transcriptional regulator [Aureimonas fodinaquatilis]KAA0971888.1 MerR family transcriptional regulator [Aureimonas fodinaquatilis]
MQSKDIAARAGVTVRTLRHYHQIGLMVEPPRDSNGYRNYSIQHLVRLLRIRRLTAIGLPLSALPPLLGENGELTSEMIEALDVSLVHQIEKLQEQRRVVAAVRTTEGPLNVEPDMAAALMPLEVGRAERSNHLGREQSALIEHFIEEGGRPELVELYQRLASPDLASIVLDLGQRFDRLGPDSADTEITGLVDDYMRHLAPWMEQFNSAVRQHSVGEEANLVLWTHAMETVTPQQRRMLMQLARRFAEAETLVGVKR